MLESLCETVSPQGIVAAVEPPKPLALADVIAGARAKGRALLIAALDGVQDPGNVGTIWRTCDAAAFDALLISESCPDPFSPKVLRASMGAAFRVPVLRVNMPKALDELRQCGCAIVSSQLDGAPFFENLPSGDAAIVIGAGDAPAQAPHAGRRGVAQRGGRGRDYDICLYCREEGG